MSDQRIQHQLPMDLPDASPPDRLTPSERPGKAWHAWDNAEDSRLTSLFRAGETTVEMARILERPPKGIAARLVRLQLIATRRRAP